MFAIDGYKKPLEVEIPLGGINCPAYLTQLGKWKDKEKVKKKLFDFIFTATNYECRLIFGQICYFPQFLIKPYLLKISSMNKIFE